MPYRRLPKTDIARIRTLRTVVEFEKEYSFQNIPLSYNLLNKAKTQLSLFEHHQNMYLDTYKKWQNNNASYRAAQNNIKTYISHFIQVYNMAVVRGEFKKDGKNHYNLSPDTNSVPDLSNEENILAWGQNLIEGERLRINHGGSPMTNPTISSVRTYYEIFKDARAELQFLQIAIQRTRENFNVERAKTDQLIKEIWDEIESNFNQLPSEEKIAECTKCGIIYYYRSSENDNIDDIYVEEYEEMSDYEKAEGRKLNIRAGNAKDAKVIKELPFDC